MKTNLLIFTLLSFFGTYAQVDPIDKNGLAVGGYDLVAYFKTGMAEKGNPKFSSTRNGVTYLFASTENRDLFISNPEPFLPQYEGYCALAVSYGKKVSIDPETFKIKDGKLYLFYYGKSGGRSFNSLDTWNKSEARLLKKANEVWPEVQKKKYKPEETPGL